MTDDHLNIPIRYDGLDASRHELDLIALGQSLQGAGKLIRAAASIVIIQPQLARSSLRMRVMAGPPQPGSYIFNTFVAPLSPLLPGLTTGANKAIEAIVSYTISRFTKKPEKTDKAFELALKCVEENGLTARMAIEAVSKIAEGQRPAVRQFVVPIGESCETAQIGNLPSVALLVDRSDREEIDADDQTTIGDEASFEILISEIDLHNRTCKLQMRGESVDKRFAGSITDPAIGMAANNYAMALSERRWLMVKAKPEMSDGNVVRLFISDSSR